MLVTGPFCRWVAREPAICAHDRPVLSVGGARTSDLCASQVRSVGGWRENQRSVRMTGPFCRWVAREPAICARHRPVLSVGGARTSDLCASQARSVGGWRENQRSVRVTGPFCRWVAREPAICARHRPVLSVGGARTSDLCASQARSVGGWRENQRSVRVTGPFCRWVAREPATCARHMPVLSVGGARTSDLCASQARSVGGWRENQRSARVTGPFCRWVAREPATCARHMPVLSVGGARTSDLCASQARSVGGWRENQRPVRVTGPFCRWVAREPAICARHRPVLSVGGARTSDLCASQARSVGGWRENQRSVRVTGPFCRWVAREPAICARHMPVLSVGGARTSDLCASQARSVGGWRENQRSVRVTGPFCRWVAREPAICARHRPVLSVGGARTSDLCASQARSVGGWRENQRSVRVTCPFCRWVAREPAICARHRPVLSVGGARTSDLCASQARSVGGWRENQRSVRVTCPFCRWVAREPAICARHRPVLSVGGARTSDLCASQARSVGGWRENQRSVLVTGPFCQWVAREPAICARHRPVLSVGGARTSDLCASQARSVGGWRENQRSVRVTGPFCRWVAREPAICARHMPVLSVGGARTSDLCSSQARSVGGWRENQRSVRVTGPFCRWVAREPAICARHRPVLSVGGARTSDLCASQARSVGGWRENQRSARVTGPFCRWVAREPAICARHRPVLSVGGARTSDLCVSQARSVGGWRENQRSARVTGPFCRWVAREPAICARHRPVLSVGGARTSDLCASQARSVGGWRENQRSVLVTGPFCRWVAREPAICACHRPVLSVGGARTSDLCASQARSVGGWRENQRSVRVTGPFCRWVAREPAICARHRPVLSVGGARTSDLCSSQARSVGGWRENQRSVLVTGPFCRWVAREPAICARHRPVLSVGGARTSDLCSSQARSVGGWRENQRSVLVTCPFCRWVAREPAICARHRPVLSVGGARTSDLCSSQARSVGGWRENQRSVLVTGPFCRWVAREPAICVRHSGPRWWQPK